MRFHTMAWFYSARGQLVHINFLQFDHNTPNRFPGSNFGGTDIEGFAYKLERETHLREKTIVNDSPHYGRSEYKIPYTEDVVTGTVSIGMKVNYFITEFLGYLTKGEPLSKIVVRKDIIEDNGRTVPYMEYTFKECRLFEHETKAQFDAPQTFNIKFTYCCAEIHCYDGNLFATHERCIPIEPDYYKIRASERSELYAQEDAARTQEKIEAARLVPTPVTRTEGAPVIHRFDVTAASEFNGQKIGPGDLDDINFHIVESLQTPDELIDYLYDEPCDATREHFKTVNNHLTESVFPGQLVLLTPVDSPRIKRDTHFWTRELEKIKSMEHPTLSDGLNFSENFIDYGNLAGMSAHGISFGTTYYQTQMRGIQQVVEELEKGYKHLLRSNGGTLSRSQMKNLRKKKFRELDALMSKAMKAKLNGAPEGPKMVKKLKLNPATVEHKWRMKNSRKIPNLSEFYQNAIKFQKLAKGLSYIAIPLGGMETHLSIEKACLEGEEACKKAKYVEWMGFAGSLAAGAGASILLSALVVPTAGGLLMIGLVAGGIFGATYIASEGGKFAGKYAGSVLYERNIERQPSITIELMGE